MASYVILGAGKFGRLALARLSARDPEARFLVIDRQAAALAEAKAMPVERAEMLAGEVIPYLAAQLGPGFPWDWLIPLVPVHVACHWLLAGPLDMPAWELAEVPRDLDDLAALAIRGAAGELYLSRARHLCPDDCAEPPVCPVTGEERPEPLYRQLARASRPELPVFVIASRQLAPGVGGYPPAALLEMAPAVAQAPGPLLVATACRCHGVIHGLKRRGGPRA
jgi:hypothetical protein